MLAIGVFANRKDKGTENYYVGGRKQNPVTIMCLWVSCWIGGASVIGTSTKGYDMGITAVWYVGMTAMGCLLFSLLLSEKVKRIGDKLQHITYPEFIESRYDGRARLVATICTLFGMIGVTASQLVAAGEILNTLTQLGLGKSFLIASVVLIAYTALGGFMAVVYTDWVQVGLLVLGIVIGVPFAAKATGGISAVRALPASYFDLGAWGWPTIIAFAVSTVLSFFTTMDSYTRCISAKSPAVAKRGGIYAALLIIPLAFCSTYEGMATKLLIPDLPAGTNVMTNLILMTFPSGIKGIVIVGILAAIMSSGDIAIITGSANITRDIAPRHRRICRHRHHQRTDRMVYAGYHEHHVHNADHPLGRPVFPDRYGLCLEARQFSGRILQHPCGDRHGHQLVYLQKLRPWQRFSDRLPLARPHHLRRDLLPCLHFRQAERRGTCPGRRISLHRQGAGRIDTKNVIPLLAG